MAERVVAENVKLTNAPKKLKSKVWKYFGFRDGGPPDKATCKLCFTDVAYPKSGATTNLIQHVNRKHNVDVLAAGSSATTQVGKVASQKSSASVSSVGNLLSGQLKVTDMNRFKLTPERTESISKSIAGYLACDMRPYSTVQNKGFKHMISTLEPRYKLPCRTHFSEKVVPALLKKVTDRVKMQLNSAESIAITTDSWTSRATENYVAVTAHFINKDWKVENYTLETKKLRNLIQRNIWLKL